MSKSPCSAKMTNRGINASPARAEDLQPGSHEYDSTSPESKYTRSWPSWDAFTTWLREYEESTSIKHAPAKKEKSKNGHHYLWKRRYACTYRPMVTNEESERVPGEQCPSVLMVKAYPGTEEIRGHVTTWHRHDISKKKDIFEMFFEDGDDSEVDEEGRVSVPAYVKNLIYCNARADKVTGCTEPIHPIINVFLFFVVMKIVAENNDRLSVQVHDSLDAVHTFLGGILQVDEAWEVDLGSCEGDKEHAHERDCVNCQIKALMMLSERTEKCTGAAKELEDKLRKTIV